MSSTGLALFRLIGVLVLMVHLLQATPENATSHRSERFFFIFTPFFRAPFVTATPCTTMDGLVGTCYTNSRCRTLELTPAGSCANAGGVCCIASKTCDQTSSSGVTYFRNPTTLPTRCTLKVHKVNSTITQLRLDFMQFSLSQPLNGRCTNFLMLSQTDTTLPKVCGENSGSHVYVNFDPLCDDHTLQFTFGNTASNNLWNIRITQISSDSDLEAPTGCLMYYNNRVTGTVTSFNFGTASDTENRQLSPLNYGVCIKPLAGYCQLLWTMGQMSMTSDSVCERSYVEIPCALLDTGVSPTGDRYCSTTQFTTATTSCKPYVLFVVTNTDETDLGTGGFSLTFQQVAC